MDLAATKLDDLLKKSKASENFKIAVQELSDGKESPLINYSIGSPKIKVLRVVMKLLHDFSDTEITEVEINGVSSCSSYVGTLTFSPGSKKIAFNWNCEWKAAQEGFKTWYGAPDQIKAAQLFGYQCFETFQEIDK